MPLCNYANASFSNHRDTSTPTCKKCTISANTNKDHRCGFEKKMELPCLWALWQAKSSFWSPYICHSLIFDRVWKEYRRTNTTGQRSHLSCLSSSLNLTALPLLLSLPFFYHMATQLGQQHFSIGFTLVMDDEIHKGYPYCRFHMASYQYSRGRIG